MLACNIGQYKLENLAKGRFTFGKILKVMKQMFGGIWQHLKPSNLSLFLTIH